MTYDVIIIGGSYAGLSAALLLGRSLRKVLVIDGGRPCNRQTPHSHGYLTRDGETPAVIAAIGREQVLAYPTVSHRSDTVDRVVRQADGFAVQTRSEGRFTARKVLLATGVEDIMPSIPGFAEGWGRSILHCPYCHGYELAGQPMGVMGNGSLGWEMVQLIQNWSKSLTLFSNGPSTLNESQLHDVRRLGVPIIESPLQRLEHRDGFLQRVHLEDGTAVALAGLFARVPFRQHSNLAEELGCELTPAGLVQATEFGETNVPGVYVAGDMSNPMRQVTLAVANGVKAGSWLNRVMIEEDLKEVVL